MTVVSWIVADLGNSALKIAEVPRTLGGPLAFARLPLRTTDWTEAVGKFVLEHGIPETGSIDWLIASVNRPAYDRLRAWLVEHRRHDRLQVVTHRDVPLRTDVVNVQRVGIDRLLAAWAAYQLSNQRGAVVVDAGSAMTIDLVDPTGVFRGGAILPGLRLQIQGLAAGTDALTEIQLGEPIDEGLTPGRETNAAIRVGVHAAAVGAIELLLKRYNVITGQTLPILLTGGDAGHLSPHLSTSVIVVPNLILQGLASIRQTQEVDHLWQARLPKI